jgi:hypothetical protein
MSQENQEKKSSDQSLRDACTAYIAASDLMRQAMEDGINVQGAMSQLVGATDNLQYEVNQINGSWSN